MAPVKNGRILYNEIPLGFPIPGKTTVYDESSTIDLAKEPLNGGVLVKVLDVSIDPYMRHRMHDPKIPDVMPAMEVGKPLENTGVGLVLRSDSPAIKQGDHVLGFFPFQHYFVAPNAQALRVLENKEKLPWSAYLGVCGMPSQTAHHAWEEFVRPILKKDDIVFVTAASGAVGAVVVQIAKSEGLKVIASAGTDEKVEYVRSLGADIAFNYKTTVTREVLEKEGPVNIYWDNVGGESLDAALEFAAQKAHFIICGMISTYNVKEPYNVRHLQQLVWREITFHGFLEPTLEPKWSGVFFKTFPARVASGEIQYKEHRVLGLENAGQALVDVLKGENFGKSVVVVSDE